jgi:colicin import membrane protein
MDTSVASPRHNGDERPSRAGYIAAIVVSALGHVALFALVFLVVPRFLEAPAAEPPAYTVKIVDNLPAGDLGTHLPRLTARRHQESSRAEPAKPEVARVEPPKTAPPPEDNDNHAIALNTKKLAMPTPTPTPEPTPEPTAAPPTPTPKPRATPKPTPEPARRTKPKTESSVAMAKTAPTPNVQEELAKIRERMLAEHLKELAKHPHAAREETADETAATPSAGGAKGGGPVVASVATAGSGYGVGSGTGSAGIQQDLNFLLYYQTVQQKIKKAWSFAGGSPELTATVDFAIAADGTLTGVKIAKSSNDSAFDDSVIRAIRSAAPFPPPPDKFRSEFAEGVQALFKLGELKS